MPDFSRLWDNTFPPDTQPANQLGLDLRQLRQDIQQRITLSGNDLSKPTNPVAGEAGMLYFALDTNKTYQWNGAAWVDVSASVFNTNVLHSVGGILNIPANYLVVGSIVEVDSSAGFANPVVASVGAFVGGYGVLSGLITFAAGDSYHVHARFSVSAIIGASAQLTVMAWGRAQLAAGSFDISLPLNGAAFPDPTAVMAVTSSGVNFAKVLK